MRVKRAGRLMGEIVMPGDKSISHRAAMLAAIASGTTRIENFAPGQDCSSTLACLTALGVPIKRSARGIIVNGCGPASFRPSSGPLDCGNSGTTMRLLAGLLAGQSFDSVLAGDASLSARPMMRVIDPLGRMGAVIDADQGRAPLRIKGGNRLAGIEYVGPVASAQVKSCILLAGLKADGRTTVVEKTKTRDHTERMLTWLGAELETSADGDAAERISINGGQVLQGKDIQVPGDISAAAFFLVAAACLPGSDLELRDVGINPTRRAVIDVLISLGVDLRVGDERSVSNEPIADLRVRGRSAGDQTPSACRLDGRIIANLIDEVPILAVMGTQLKGGIEIRDAGELRHKESDRIAAIVGNLQRMGAAVEEFPDGLRVERSHLSGAAVDAFGDHRIAMAFAVAGLLAEGETEIAGAECADISYPGFFETLGSISRKQTIHTKI